jgi:sugar/nucleoside kinase (ribokinase family)
MNFSLLLHVSINRLPMKKVVGMGNALTDMLVNLRSDEVLARFGLPRGSMTLVDSALQKEISRSVAGLPYTLSLGGSVANAIRALARLGGRTGFIGKVGRDSTGDFFEAALVNLGVEPFVFRGEEHSGRCVALVSPDGERTMVTFLGAAMEMSAPEVTEELFRGYDYLFLEGYLVQNHALIEAAARTARKAGAKVALDLASFNVVEENLEFLHGLVANHIDILFANESEASAFTGEAEPLNALQAISEMCELAIVKIGMNGALIKRGDEVVHVGIMKAARRVDTTGAGDFYAAGFLYGLCKGLSLRQCGTIGAITAGKVIEVVGTTFGEDEWLDIARLVQRVETQKYLF